MNKVIRKLGGGEGIEITTPPFPFHVDTPMQLSDSDQSSLTYALELQMINPASIQSIQNTLLGCALPCETLATETVENLDGIGKDPSFKAKPRHHRGAPFPTKSSALQSVFNGKGFHGERFPRAVLIRRPPDQDSCLFRAYPLLY